MVESKRTFIRLLTCGLDPLEMLNLSAIDGTPTNIVGLMTIPTEELDRPSMYLVSIASTILYASLV